MKLRGLLLAAAGLVVVGGLVAWAGPRTVADALGRIGWSGFVLVLATQLVLACVAASAWAILAARATGVRLRGFVWARLVREAVGQALPFTQIGGIAVGARALALEGAPGHAAIASTVADTALEFLSQVVYAALGAALLATLRPREAIVVPLALTVSVLLVMAGLLLLALRRGAPWIERRIRGLAGGRPGDGRLPVSETLADLRRRPGRAALAGGTHLAGWVLTAGQTWLILKLLHAPVGLGAAVAIDSLTSAARAAAFVAPAGLGVQEMALVALCQVFGVGAPAALALSLVRRGRDLALAGPVLAAWQARHGGRIWARGGTKAAAAAQVDP